LQKTKKFIERTELIGSLQKAQKISQPAQPPSCGGGYMRKLRVFFKEKLRNARREHRQCNKPLSTPSVHWAPWTSVGRRHYVSKPDAVSWTIKKESRRVYSPALSSSERPLKTLNSHMPYFFHSQTS